MGDSESLTVDFDDFSKGMSFYLPEHPQKGFCTSASHQQLDRSLSGASTDTSEQLYSSPDLSATEQMDKLSSKTSVEKNTLTDVGETRLELQNGVHRGKENGSSDAGIESLMTSLGQLALSQSGAMNTRHTGSWDEQTLSSAMYHLLAQSGNGQSDSSVGSQQRMGTTGGSMATHSQRQHLALGNVPVALQQGNASHSNLESYQSWNDGSVPIQGSWARLNMHYNGSWNQRRAMAYIPSGQLGADSSVIVPKNRQNSPFPKSLQHLVATSKSSDLRSCDSTVHIGSCLNFQQVNAYAVVSGFISNHY